MGQRIHDIPEEDRPRERLLRQGAAALSDAELLGIFINTGMKGENAVQIGQRLLSSFNGLRQLSRRSAKELSKQKGLGPAKAAVMAAAFELGQRAAREAAKDLPMSQPEQVFDYLGLEMQAMQREELHVLLLNTRLCLTHHERLYRGGIAETVAVARDVFQHTLMHSAFGFLVVHNHPSGDPTPSDADRRFTRRLKEGADLLSVHFVDHVIIGHPSPDRPLPFFSFRAAGLIQ
ncbi:MAG: RadC family protein [Roseimicrobium sp.]|jgi:DNA repair protein RadC